MAPKSGFAYNGIQYVSWWHDEYAQSANASASIDALAATGADSAGILVTWYWDPQSDRIRPDPLRTPTDDALQYAMDELHGRGLQVMLKPHIDGPDGTWRGNMKPSPVNGSVWFQEYKAFITRYAALAQSNAAELLAIGTELKQISSNAPFWTDVIQSVRAMYAGMLTYAANAVSADDEFTAVPFWDQLDLIGLNAYFPLTNMDDPPVPALVAAWSRNLNNLDAIAAVKSVHTAYNKPVVFTEIGYRSARDAIDSHFFGRARAITTRRSKRTATKRSFACGASRHCGCRARSGGIGRWRRHRRPPPSIRRKEKPPTTH